ncbi:MAG TPA: hypothetical protein VD865_02955 [Stenotrophomonas sp.]|nr:hypothetical protein [Stenotrophomonas sp.]
MLQDEGHRAKSALKAGRRRLICLMSVLALAACSSVDQEQIFTPDDCARALQQEGTRYYPDGRTGFPSSECMHRIEHANPKPAAQSR